MDFDSQIGGVEPGGISDIYEAKILICFVLDSLGEKVEQKVLDQIMFADSFINYFTYSDALRSLISTGHVYEQEDGFVLGELGKETSHRLSFSLPKSLREKVVRASVSVMSKIKKASAITALCETSENGYLVRCGLHDAFGDIFDLSLFAPNSLQAGFLCDNYKENPELLYKGIIALLLKDEKVLSEIVKEIADEQ